MLVLAKFCVLELHLNHHVQLFFLAFSLKFDLKNPAYRIHRPFKCCKQGLCQILQDWGKYFSLTIPCFVVNPFYVAIAHSLW